MRRGKDARSLRLLNSAGTAEVSGEHVAGGAVQVVAAAIVAPRGTRRRGPHGVLQVAQAGPGVQISVAAVRRRNLRPSRDHQGGRCRVRPHLVPDRPGVAQTQGYRAGCQPGVWQIGSRPVGEFGPVPTSVAVNPGGCRDTSV